MNLPISGSRWYSLPWGDELRTAEEPGHPLTVYATVQLPTPLKVTRWGPPREGSDLKEGPGPSSGLGCDYMCYGDEVKGSQESTALFVDTQVLVTIQVRRVFAFEPVFGREDKLLSSKRKYTCHLCFSVSESGGGGYSCHS